MDWEKRILKAYAEDTLHKWRRYEYVAVLKYLKLPVKKDKMYILYENICKHFSLDPNPEHCKFLSECRSSKKKVVHKLMTGKKKKTPAEKLEIMSAELALEKRTMITYLKKICGVKLEDDWLSYHYLGQSIQKCTNYFFEIQKLTDICAIQDSAEDDESFEDFDFKKFEEDLNSQFN